MNRNLFCGILLSMAAVPVIAQESGDNIFSYKVGNAEVYTLVETRRSGGVPDNLIGAGAEMTARYYPGGVSQSQTNTFLVRNGKRIFLFDTGFGTTLFDSLRELGIRADMVDAVLITHMHGDHIGGLAKDGAALFPKATVYIADIERDYWTKTSVNQGAIAALKPYGRRVKTFKPGELGTKIRDILPGITPIAAFGHTPGHTMFMLESAGQKLLIWGDIIHAQPIQFPRPDISVTYDSDPAAAARVRTKVLEYVAANNIPIAGMHLLYPAIGTVSAADEGYALTNAE